MGEAFPELRRAPRHLERTIRAEEEGFLRTLGTGIEMFESFTVSCRELKDVPRKREIRSTLALAGPENNRLLGEFR
jgi:alanyl-tRNA synthetase